MSDNERGSRLGEIDDLPDELKSQLVGMDVDGKDTKVCDIVIDFSGVANINEIMVGLYRKYNQIIKRHSVQSRVNRMVAKGRLFRTPGNRGYYQTSDPVGNKKSEPDASTEDSA